MAKIIKVNTANNKYEVTYESSVVRYYGISTAPKTVLKWLEDNTPTTPDIEEFFAPVPVVTSTQVATHFGAAPKGNLNYVQLLLALAFMGMDLYYVVTTQILCWFEKAKVIWKYDLRPLLQVEGRRLRQILVSVLPVVYGWLILIAILLYKGTAVLISTVTTGWNFRSELLREIKK